MSFETTVSEIADGWETLVKKIMSDGNEIRDERGSMTKEVLNTIVTIEKPLGLMNDLKMIRIPKGYFWHGEKLEKYCEQFISEDKQGFIYTYGNRLRGYFAVDELIDQIKESIERLKKCNESRRAISVTWDPNVDVYEDEVPCMILVDFKIRDGKLQTTALWRSHDIYQAWFANVVGLTYLAEYVAGELDIPVGSVTIHSISAHVYEINWQEAEEFLGSV